MMCASGTIPVKLLLQLATVFKPGGLQNREGTISYMNQLKSCKVPVLAVAGDKDLICPPIAVTGKYHYWKLVLVYFSIIKPNIWLLLVSAPCWQSAEVSKLVSR